MVDFDDDVRLDTGQVSDRRGRRLGGRGLAIGGGGAGGLVVLALVLISAFTGGGGNLGGLAALEDGTVGGGVPGPVAEECRTGADADRREDCRVVAFVNSVQAHWRDVFARRGARYRPATTVFFSGSTDSGCGAADSSVGPFYCRADGRVYVDLGFFGELRDRFGAQGGPFAQGYVIAHEYGHHVQNLTGVLDRVGRDRGTGPQSAAVRSELQADCYAGVWAAGAVRTGFITRLTQQDVDDALSAAAAVGDDRIQSRVQGRVTPESWTHGSAAQRGQWFRRGLSSGDPGACDTFSGPV